MTDDTAFNNREAEKNSAGNLIIQKAINSAIEQCVPSIKIGPNQQPKWFNATLRHHIKCVRTLRKKYLWSPSENNQMRLQTAESNLSNKFIQTKLCYESSLINNFACTNDSKIYQYIRSLTNSNLIPTTVYLDSLTAQDVFDKALQSIFSLCFHHQSYWSSPWYQQYWIFVWQPFSLYIHIRGRSAWSTQLPRPQQIDGIGPNILKHCALSLCKPLHFLFTLTLQKHQLPIDWKIHFIVPIFKSDDKSLVNIYRPISLLCNISTVMECLVLSLTLSPVYHLISLDF